MTTCKLSFHGAAGNSTPHSLKWVNCPRAAVQDDNSDSRSFADGATSAGDGSHSAANNESVQVLLYPSSGVINVATSVHSTKLNAKLTSVAKTFITSSLANNQSKDKKVLARGEAAEDAAAKRSITALDWVDNTFTTVETTNPADNPKCGIVASFSDGTLTTFRYGTSWMEHVLIGNTMDEIMSSSIQHVHESVDWTSTTESIADVSVVALLGTENWLIGTASASGVMLVLSSVSSSQTGDDVVESLQHQEVWVRQISHHSAASITIVSQEKECLIFFGSASPRHNKVWVYTLPLCQHNTVGLESANAKEESEAQHWAALSNITVGEPQYQGCLLGHQDWITCFAWLDPFNACSEGGSSSIDPDRKDALLASSGHDAKIRLWKFSSSNTGSGQIDANHLEELSGEESNDSDEDEANIDDLIEGEARLVLHHAANHTTMISLEALLLGHEEGITSLSWRNPTKSKRPCLLSSSMDRSILLWMEQEYEQDNNVTSGVWVPISRVGSAGGILGGSIGASLMGFVDAAFSPDCDRIVGHGYGGSLHFWSRVRDDEGRDDDDPANEDEENHYEIDDDLTSARWLADPCITGHFRAVQDLNWDPNGEYLLSVGSDQTTRMWAEVPVTGSSKRWMEVGRPQVHGYDMTSITCIGGERNDDENAEPMHRFVSGADEKVIRVFDAPSSTLRLLSTLKRLGDQSAQEEMNTESSWRVERAFLPSLGLSNKATADTEQESAKYAGPTNDDEFVLDTMNGKQNELKLPSERDLGVTTLWPETRKLFGHASELVCLDSYRAQNSSSTHDTTLVASSCKARNDVASAAIRVWNAKEGKCVCILKGGHKSTVSTLSFSTDGKYLASSGKDRRICIWRRGISDDKTK
ncbi:hypothetical protein ACHAXN_000578, partial [Cyclotella atomus]